VHKLPKKCIEPGCNFDALARSLCPTHYSHYRTLLRHIGIALPPIVKGDPQIVVEHFIYEGQEEILIRRERWIDEHPNAQKLMTWDEVDTEIAKEDQELN